MIYKYTAIIIEPRKHKALNFVLSNMLECLSNEWKIIFFHGNNNIEYSKNICDNLNKLFDDRIFLIQLDVNNLNQVTYSKLLSTKSVIYDHVDTDYFLVFQTDSMMLKANKHLLENFLDKNYDYVGAPWLICGYQVTQERDFIGNGGFSLRKTKTMLKIIENNKWDENNGIEWHEDLYFTKKYNDIVLVKPEYNMAKEFCVDEVFSDVALACHRPWFYPHFEYFSQIYPECKILKDLQEVEN